MSDFDFFKSFTGEAVADAAFTKTLALGPLTFIDPSTGLALSKSDFSLVSDFWLRLPSSCRRLGALGRPGAADLCIFRPDCWRCGWRQQTSRAFACFLVSPASSRSIECSHRSGSPFRQQFGLPNVTAPHFDLTHFGLFLAGSIQPWPFPLRAFTFS